MPFSNTFISFIRNIIYMEIIAYFLMKMFEKKVFEMSTVLLFTVSTELSSCICPSEETGGIVINAY